MYIFTFKYDGLSTSISLYNWLKENIALDGWWISACSSDCGYRINIKNEEDAALFRLSWLDRDYKMVECDDDRSVSI